MQYGEKMKESWLILWTQSKGMEMRGHKAVWKAKEKGDGNYNVSG